MSKQSFSSGKGDDIQDFGDSGAAYKRRTKKHEELGHRRRQQEPASAEQRLQIQRMQSSEEKYRLISPSNIILKQGHKNQSHDSDEEMLDARHRRSRRQIEVPKKDDDISD